MAKALHAGRIVPGSNPGGGGGSKCVDFMLWSMAIYIASRLFFCNHAPGICPPPPFQSLGMHGAGMWGGVGHTSMQCVSCCCADGSEGRSRGALAASVIMETRARWAAPPAGLNNRTRGLQQW